MRCYFLRQAGLTVVGFLLIAAGEPAPPPPGALVPYIHDGSFDPGDYRWMRGQFKDASGADKQVSRDITSWLNLCFARALEAAKLDLAKMGIEHSRLQANTLGASLCRQVFSAFAPEGPDTFADFQLTVERARPILSTYLLATEIAEAASAPKSGDLSHQLLARTIGDQVLRAGLNWGSGRMANVPVLDTPARSILLSRLWIAAIDRDNVNTVWLKKTVKEQGWPKKSIVGSAASDRAWLLVQHADADPAFQLEALRLMEPLAKSDEIARDNFAYLYDRITLKLTGKQRYGTQFTCEKGQRVPLPLEDSAGVDRERAEMALGPLIEYKRLMDGRFGACPAN
jgi:hypothetical protein